MSINEMKRFLSGYGRLKYRAGRVNSELKSNPDEAKYLKPLLLEIERGCAAIVEAISNVENSHNRELLYRKYICGETLEELGDNLGYSPRHVSRLLSLAIASMNEVESGG